MYCFFHSRCVDSSCFNLISINIFHILISKYIDFSYFLFLLYRLIISCIATTYYIQRFISIILYLINANYMKKISSYKKVSSSCLFNILSFWYYEYRIYHFSFFFFFCGIFFYITLKRGNRVYLAKKQWLV